MSQLTLNRRKIVLTTVAGISGLIAPTGMAFSQNAQPAIETKQAGNVGHYSFLVGDICATVLSDGLIGALRESMRVMRPRRNCRRC
jgi:hypothetical protein